MSEQPEVQPEQIPVELWVATLQDELGAKNSLLLQAAARIKYRDETIRQLQEQNVALQKRVTELEDAASLPQPA